MNILIFLVILLVLVTAHEWGHFFTAKKFGIRVDEFGFGFPPKAMTLFKKGETTYTLNWLPIGGFVKIFGENPDEESLNGPDKDRSFINKPRWQQAIVLFAGVFMNFIVAWLLFSFGFMSGLPMSTSAEGGQYATKDQHLMVVSVMPGSPAESAGLQSSDKIIALNTTNKELSVVNVESVRDFIAQNGMEVLRVTYSRGKSNEINSVDILPISNTEENRPMIGIAMDMIGIAKLPVHLAFWEGLKLDWYVTKSTFLGLYNLLADAIRGNGTFASVTGPVGMVGIVGDAYDFGFSYLLSFAALISVNLAIINLVPFPALDGGRLLFLLIEKIKGSRLNPKFANTANAIGFALLILLMLIVTYKDIARLL